MLTEPDYSQPWIARSSTEVVASEIGTLVKQSFSANRMPVGTEQGMSLPEVTPLTEGEQLAYEKEALGLYLTGHPIDRLADKLKDVGVKRIEELVALERSVSVSGIISQSRALRTRKGDSMAVITLEDRGGTLDVVVFPEVYGKYGTLIDTDKIVVVRGRLEKDEESGRLLATKIESIEAVLASAGQEMAVRITSPPHDRSTLEALADLFGHHQGAGRVAIEMELRSQVPPVKLRAKLSRTRIQASEQLIEEVERICGKGSVSWS